MNKDSVYTAKFTFQGHYNEPALEIQVPRSAFENNSCRIAMNFCPFRRQWIEVNVQDVKSRENLNTLKFNSNGSTAKVDEKKQVPAKKAAPKVTNTLKAPSKLAAPERKESPATSASSKSNRSMKQ